MKASLIQKKKDERAFLEQLLDNSKLQNFTVPIPIKADLRQYQQVRIVFLWRDVLGCSSISKWIVSESNCFVQFNWGQFCLIFNSNHYSSSIFFSLIITSRAAPHFIILFDLLGHKTEFWLYGHFRTMDTFSGATNSAHYWYFTVFIYSLWFYTKHYTRHEWPCQE